MTESFKHSAGEVGRAGVDHGVVIGERNVAEELAVVVPIERPPAAVAVLHGQHPAQAQFNGRERVFEFGDLPVVFRGRCVLVAGQTFFSAMFSDADAGVVPASSVAGDTPALQNSPIGDGVSENCVCSAISTIAVSSLSG